jgi:hypothetical protein
MTISIAKFRWEYNLFGGRLGKLGGELGRLGGLGGREVRRRDGLGLRSRLGGGYGLKGAG